ncbi:biotin/lipoyl-containing protein [Brachyspira hampsonii]|uniref:Acetyl-CoA carboxylase biotin carboxyl carrier protein subunit n=1 Tax=Brachyspira hampsonii 30446 TaxID=1289135 RepID=A0A2U4F148_9SPIR|nr:biotin/lipoyl-containing protein [Brachyspira hampsonii]EKV58002.1 acetyl-CoA carboxylase biotin carboxyl carrier protein subunit [Brachyspira hampsonii 30446]MBW5388845.1 biotin/lipoyl-binding protein [Brachyspira hampsonii]MBW5393759.1 biotin/lipoyl-binding protein [Brachyspira hampsonii]OEJ16688.1 acetyl-CoA carboxylase biotin carboxyl carrier protein subunit [Brachyspira hampsonii]
MTKQYKITVNGKTYDVSVEEVRAVASNKTVSTIVNAPVNTAKPVAESKPAPAPAAPAPAPIDENAISIKAPMPGTIVSFNVAVGDKINEGQVVAILEAMKMENEIVSPASGEVKSIHVEKGSSVVDGQVILQIK